MRTVAILLLLLTMGTYVGAQKLDTVFIVNKARKFKPREHILLMFEVLDTVDVAGKNSSMSRSYYFDKEKRKISYVREYYNPRKPEKGTQVIYSFAANNLSAVTVIPPRSTCRNCESRYYYSHDSLLSKEENPKVNVNSAVFVQQARYFQSKLPEDLPWGFFEDEVMVNGKKEKLKKSY